AVSTVGAGSANVIHLPRTSFVAIGTRGKSADRANVNAHAALFALEMIFFIRGDDRTHAAVLHPEGPHVHGLAANPHTAITEDATRAIKVNHRRPLLLVTMILGLDVLRLSRAVRECHVLQFAFAAGIAYRTIERMVAEQQFHHALASLADLVTVRGDDHALADHRS